MAILRSMDGKFYNIPDDDLEANAVPPEEVKEKLGEAAGCPGGPPPGNGGGGQPMSIPGGGQVVIQIYTSPGGGGSGGAPPQGGAPAQAEGAEGDLVPHAYCWRNTWSRNCWRNNWRNCY